MMMYLISICCLLSETVVSFYLLREVLQRIQSYLAKTTVLRTSVSRQTISRAGINKNKHSLASAQLRSLISRKFAYADYI